jgi:rare lipoprotein A
MARRLFRVAPVHPGAPVGVMIAALGVMACVPSAATAPPPRPGGSVIEATEDPPPSAARVEVEEGFATWYGGKFAGRKTASGERFQPMGLTAAHRTLPFGTWVEVKRVDTGASVRVRITDRGPFGDPSQNRIIDLSRGAAEKIGLVKSGVTRVELRTVEGP